MDETPTPTTTNLGFPLFSYLPDVSVAGEKAAEFLSLFKSLTTDDSSKMYLASKGILQTIGELLSAVSCTRQAGKRCEGSMVHAASVVTSFQCLIMLLLTHS